MSGIEPCDSWISPFLLDLMKYQLIEGGLGRFDFLLDIIREFASEVSLRLMSAGCVTPADVSFPTDAVAANLHWSDGLELRKAWVPSKKQVVEALEMFCHTDMSNVNPEARKALPWLNDGILAKMRARHERSVAKCQKEQAEYEKRMNDVTTYEGRKYQANVICWAIHDSINDIAAYLEGRILGETDDGNWIIDNGVDCDIKIVVTPDHVEFGDASSDPFYPETKAALAEFRAAYVSRIGRKACRYEGMGIRQRCLPKGQTLTII